MLNEIEVDTLNDAFRVRTTSSSSSHTPFRLLILQIFILNRKRLSEMHTWASPFIRTASYMFVLSIGRFSRSSDFSERANTRLANGLSGSKSNIS
jgi:hypothetical protein